MPWPLHFIGLQGKGLKPPSHAVPAAAYDGVHAGPEYVTHVLFTGQTTGALPAQVPLLLHTSLVVFGLPSLQGVPAGKGVGKQSMPN